MIINKAKESQGFSNNLEITFLSAQEIHKDTVVSVTCLGNEIYFKVSEVEAVDKIAVKVTAQQYGDPNVNFDIRKLLDLSVKIITNQATLNVLKQRSTWC